MSNRLLARISASAIRNVPAWWTLLSTSPVVSNRWPFRLAARSEFFSMSYSKETSPSSSTTSFTPSCFSDQFRLYTSLLWFPEDDTATLKKSGYTSIAAVDMNPPPEWP